MLLNRDVPSRTAFLFFLRGAQHDSRRQARVSFQESPHERVAIVGCEKDAKIPSSAGENNVCVSIQYLNARPFARRKSVSIGHSPFSERFWREFSNVHI